MRHLLVAAALLAAAAPAASADPVDWKSICVQITADGVPPLPEVCVPVPVDIGQ